jgi:bifunctional DNase/RNase
MYQVTVAGMILDKQTRGPVLLLHIPPLDKYLPIWIGPSEAAAINMALKQERFERPLTHDLLVTVIDALEGKVSKVTITEQRDNTFFAKIFIERGQQVLGIDARPSDSIAIAMRAEAPIFVAKKVLEQEKDHLLTLDEEPPDGMPPNVEGGKSGQDPDFSPGSFLGPPDESPPGDEDPS